MITAKVKGLEDLHRKFAALEKVGQDKIITKAAYAAGLIIEGQAKANIREDDLIDTGFMLNSVYTSSLYESDYGDAKGAAKEANPKERMIAEYRHQKPGRAVVMVGAEYAIYQHDGTSRIAAHPFLLQALETKKVDALNAAADVFRDEIKKAI